ncbi:MAG TPA: RNA methyltransferase [Aestuariivirgaceae bacterium]|nr:RNA methyltransferase [Aestuariivirgaceae bacterium]
MSATTLPDDLAGAEPFCPHYGTCGGCQLQHVSDDAARRWKIERVAQAVSARGVPLPGDGIAYVPAEGEGRRRLTLHARRESGTLAVGYMAARSHRIAAIDACPVAIPALREAPAIVAALASAAGRFKALDVQLTATATGIDCDLRGLDPAPEQRSALAAMADRHDLARLTLDGEPLALRRQPVVRMGRAAVALPPQSFLQATEQGEIELARRVSAACDGARRVADLFCGVGPFALRLAETVPVLAHDADATAIQALRQAAATTPGLKPVAAQPRDLFRHPLGQQELQAVDAVVFDPPRQGAEAQARALARSRPRSIIAISCDARSFARDAGILHDGGFKLTSLTIVDQFRWTTHIEIAALFRR